MKTRIAVAAIAALCCLACSASASADSLVYIKGHNLWTSKPDGSRARALTTNGTAKVPYQSPSQADDGTILVQLGQGFGVFKASGRFLRQFAPATGSAGPYEPVISPDGKKYAHWVYVTSGYTDQTTDIYFYSQGHPTVWGDIATGRTTGFTSAFNKPVWEQNSTQALVFDENAYASPAVYSAPVNEYNDPQGWFRDSNTGDGNEVFGIAGGDISPRGTHLALMRATDYAGNGASANQPGNQLTLYNANGLGSPPEKLPCSIKDPGGAEIVKASFSPDGNALSYSTTDATWVTPFNGSCASVSPRKLIPGATEAFWGPADHPAGATGGCRALQGKKRIACAYKVAVKKCTGVAARTRKGKAKRARCLVKARRTRALATCRARPARSSRAGKARARCVRQAKRRYR